MIRALLLLAAIGLSGCASQSVTIQTKVDECANTGGLAIVGISATTPAPVKVLCLPNGAKK